MADDLGDLRSSLIDDMDDDAAQERYEAYVASAAHNERIFGMTAVERMFVSIGCFFVVSLGGFLLLLIAEKIAI
jgi:hypothetical protein